MPQVFSTNSKAFEPWTSHRAGFIALPAARRSPAVAQQTVAGAARASVCTQSDALVAKQGTYERLVLDHTAISLDQGRALPAFVNSWSQEVWVGEVEVRARRPGADLSMCETCCPPQQPGLQWLGLCCAGVAHLVKAILEHKIEEIVSQTSRDLGAVYSARSKAATGTSSKVVRSSSKQRPGTTSGGMCKHRRYMQANKLSVLALATRRCGTIAGVFGGTLIAPAALATCFVSSIRRTLLSV